MRALRGHAHAVVAARRRAAPPGARCSARCATTRANSPPASARPTTTACACSRSRSISRATTSTSRRIPRRPRCADRGPRVQRDLRRRQPVAAARSIDVGDLDPTSTRSAEALELLWHAPTHEYCSRDAVTHEPLSDRTIATFLPLLTHRTRTTDELVARLQDPGGLLVGVPGAERPAGGPPLPGPPLLEGPHLGEHQLDDRRGVAPARARRPRRRPARAAPSRWSTSTASPSTSRPPTAPATARPSSRGPPRSPIDLGLTTRPTRRSPAARSARPRRRRACDRARSRPRARWGRAARSPA